MKNLIYTAVVILSVLAIQSCKSEGQNQQMAAAHQTINLPVTQISTKDIVGYQEYPTNIEGKVNNAVRAKISGYITHVYVDEGQYVSKGQPLFKLETNVQSQDANAAQSAIGAADSNISAANAAIKAAQAGVDAAQLEVDKLKPLVEKNIIGGVQLETAQANLMRAQSQLQQAQAAKRQAEAGKQQAQAGYNAVKANIDYGTVRSPISGVLGTINFREGSLVGPGDPTPITTVSETGEVYAYFSMNESQYFDFLENTEGQTVKQKLNQLPEVDLVLPNGQTYPEKGKIKTVTGQIDPATGTIQFRASFANKNGLLSNGNSGFIRIPQSYNDALIVPTTATFEQQGSVYVYKVKNDTAYSTRIMTEAEVNNRTIVNSGLEKGDIIVIKGMGKLRNGTPMVSQMTDFEEAIQPIETIMSN